METKTKQFLAVGLSLLSSAGTIATAISAVKQYKKKENVVEIEKPSQNKKEKFVEFLKDYWPTLIFGTATVASTLASTLLSKRVEASLTSAAILVDQGWRKYNGKIKEALGVKEYDDLLTGLASKSYPKDYHKDLNDPRQMYWEEHIGYFLAEPEKLALAYADLNQRLQIEDFGKTSCYAMIYNLIKDANAEIVKKDDNACDENWGWTNEYLGETYGYVWVHMNYEEIKLEDGFDYTKITFTEDPIYDPGNYGESFIGRDCPTENNFKLSGKLE